MPEIRERPRPRRGRVHVQELGLCGASDADVLARAISEDRITVTSNAEDFRRLGARTPAHSGLTLSAGPSS